MPSREEIINSLNACMDVHQSGLWSSGCMLCAYEKQSNPKCFMDLTKDVIELLKEQPVKDTNVPSKWISVEDRLPDKQPCEYLVVNGNNVETALCLDNRWITPRRVIKITHWMPLPEPPKEVKQDD